MDWRYALKPTHFSWGWQAKPSAGVLNINWDKIAKANPLAAKPASTPAWPCFSCVPASSGAAGSASLDTVNATLVPIHRTTLARLMTIRRQPAVHWIAIRAVQLRFQQPFIQPQKSLRAAIANLKISPPTAIRLRHHLRPDPQILPLATPPSVPVSSHLIGNHGRRAATYHAGSALFASPAAHPRQCGAPLNPPADRRHADPENPGNGLSELRS